MAFNTNYFHKQLEYMREEETCLIQLAYLPSPMSNSSRKRKRLDEDYNESDSESFDSNFSYQEMDECTLSSSDKLLIKSLSMARLGWENSQSLVPYHYRQFWQNVADKYNTSTSNNEYLDFETVVLRFRKIAKKYNADDSFTDLNLVREGGTVMVPGPNFQFKEDGGPEGDYTNFHMRIEDRDDDDDIVPHIFTSLLKPQTPDESFEVVSSVERAAYSKIASDSSMTPEDCGYLILGATYGSPRFTQILDTPEDKRVGASHQIIRYVRGAMDQKY